MERLGFVRDMLDVKVLILYVMARVEQPISVQKIYELCLQDDRLTYFDVCEAVPQLVETGHLRAANDLYEITDAGKEACSIMEDTVAYPVAQRAKEAADKFNRDARRNSLIHTAITEQSGGTYSVRMGLDNEDTTLLELELMAPSISQARRLERTFRKKAEKIYQLVMSEFLAKPEKEE